MLAIQLVSQSCPTLCDPMDCNPLGSSVHGISQQEYWSGLPFPSAGDLPNPGIKPGSPALQAESFPSEPQGKPRHEPRHLKTKPQRCVNKQTGGNQKASEAMKQKSVGNAEQRQSALPLVAVKEKGVGTLVL